MGEKEKYIKLKRKSNTTSGKTLTRPKNSEVCRESIVTKPSQDARINKTPRNT